MNNTFMQDKNFSSQNLRGRSFKNQDLTGADFSSCDLRGVNFSGCDLRGVDFSGCDLHGVDFSRADLTAAKFCNARMGKTLEFTFGIFLLQLLSGALNAFFAILGNLFLIWFTEEILKAFELNSDNNQLVFVLIFTLLLTTVCLISVNHKRLDYLGYFFALFIVVAVAVVVAIAVTLVGAGAGAVALTANSIIYCTRNLLRLASLEKRRKSVITLAYLVIKTQLLRRNTICLCQVTKC